MAASSYFPRVSGLAAASRRAGFSINLTSHARVSHLLATMSPHSARVFYPEALSHAHGAEPVPAPRSFDEYTWRCVSPTHKTRETRTHTL